ncbi:MAG: acyl-CoA synthetase [Microbacterium sp.]
MPAPSRPLGVRHAQLFRAALAAAAALMVTFSQDHSAAVGMAVFSGFALSTSLVLVISAWLVYPAGRRWWVLINAAASFVIGMFASVPALRTPAVFFGLVIGWAVFTGLWELIAGLRARGAEGARDQVLTGALGLLLGLALALVPVIPNGNIEAIIAGVGVFGGYAAIVAVLLGIAGLTPRAGARATTPAVEAEHGGAS